MNDGWELPIIVNEISKKKFCSASLYQMPRSLQGRKKANKSMSKCLKNKVNQMRQILKQTKVKMNPVNYRKSVKKLKQLDIFNSKSHTQSNTKLNLSSYEKVPQNLTTNAFKQLSIFFHHYFKTKTSLDLINQKAKLLNILSDPNKSLNQSLELFKQSEQVFLDEGISMLYHEISAQNIKSENKNQQALYHFLRAQYYALKCNLHIFGIYCLSEQTQIYKERGQFQLGLISLKKALSLAIQSNNKETISLILEKIGIYYYYNGNTIMGQYFHFSAEKGLKPKQAEIYRSELNLPRYLNSMQEKIFGTGQESLQQRVNQIIFEQNNVDVQAEYIEQRYNRNIIMISQMLKDNKLRGMGKKLQKQINSTTNLSNIISHVAFPISDKKQNIHQKLPMINVSRVLKSHMSLSRNKTNSSRNWQLERLFQIIGFL